MDIDIDLPTTFDPKQVFDCVVPASTVRDGDLKKHPCGHYFQYIPVDKVTNLAAIPYEEAEALGYFKIDFLHLSTLDLFTTKQQIRTLVNKEPKWSLLLVRENVEKLFQIHRHHGLLQKVQPKSVVELADCIALIRPGKKHLVDSYVADRVGTRPQLYVTAKDGYTFRKSHAIAYALTIVLQLHLIEHGIL